MQGNENGTLVFVSDLATVETLMWDPGTSAFSSVFPTFDNLDMDYLWLADLNGDTYDEIITWGTSTSGTVLVSDDNIGIYGTSAQTGLEAPEGATVVDYDADGVLDILIPENSVADDDDTTMNGSLMIYNFVAGVLTDTNRNLTPRTMPSFAVSGDLTGDGHPEIIAYCGEQELSKGIFIDSWHMMSYDFDGDGITELSAEGFGQSDSGANGSQVIRVTDSSGTISNTIDLNKANYISSTDSYNNEIMSISSEVTLNSAGAVLFQNLIITYSWQHTIEDLYDNSGHNLTTFVNSDLMEFGTQNFTHDIWFDSSNAGELILENLRLVTSVGHPELPDLDPLVLTATNVEEDLVDMRWTEVTTGSQYFDSYQLYRSSVVNATFPGDYNLLSTSTDHTDVSYTDSGLPEGAHYEYVVRATFSAGGLFSAISNVIVIDLPAVPSVKNIIAVDTPDDLGGSIDISWDEVDDRFSGYYDVYVLTEDFTDTTLLDSVVTLQNTDTSYSAAITSTVNDENGDIVTNAQYIENEQALWVAVVATN
ncbi:MAG: fibronectin type III domain-containing protein, partial [Candidatus Thermoplasmatota archaeon]|nr:fibronectin type III domain-containing protein [Candidatus Thermoplasmatota archaeon]